MVLVNNYVKRRVNLQLKLIVVLYIWNVTIYVSRHAFSHFTIICLYGLCQGSEFKLHTFIFFIFEFVVQVIQEFHEKQYRTKRRREYGKISRNLAFRRVLNFYFNLIQRLIKLKLRRYSSTSRDGVFTNALIKQCLQFCKFKRERV